VRLACSIRLASLVCSFESVYPTPGRTGLQAPRPSHPDPRFCRRAGVAWRGASWLLLSEPRQKAEKKKWRHTHESKGRIE
jgi:hypothetical protein